MEEEIKEEFMRNGFTLEDDKSILQKCLTFCINYKLKPSDLVSSWEVFYLNRQLDDSVVRNAEMDGFLLHLQHEQIEMAVKDEPGLHSYTYKDVEMLLNSEDGDKAEDTPGTPTDRSENLNLEYVDSAPRTYRSGYSSSKQSQLVTPFGQRKDKFMVKFSIDNLPSLENGDNTEDHENPEDEIIKRVQMQTKCSLVVHGSAPEPGCRFMYDRVEDRFNALENRIRKHASAFVSSGIYEEPMDPSIASQKSIFAVGMICCDGEGHLNDKSVLLQSSVEHSGGQRVRLELHKLNYFSIFPGQVVGIEGSNPSGHCLIASKLVDNVPLSAGADTDLPPAKKQVFDQEIQSTSLSCTPDDISMIIAAGPFTTTDNLSFEPLTELLAYATRNPPQLLILLGPFVDVEHPQIKKGGVDLTFDEIFRLEVLKKLHDFAEYMGSEVRVVLIPSIRDAHHDFVFPQPPFDIHPRDAKDQITSLTNPGTFEANQVKIACCTVDILKQLSAEEMSRNPADGTAPDRLSRLSSHILSQRSFYPLYPPAEGIPLDFSLALEALRLSTLPDLLILPSDIKFFVKLLNVAGKSEGKKQAKCVCINPGRLAKGEGSGTFVELKYKGSPDMMNASVIGI